MDLNSKDFVYSKQIFKNLSLNNDKKISINSSNIFNNSSTAITSCLTNDMKSDRRAKSLAPINMNKKIYSYYNTPTFLTSYKERIINSERKYKKMKQKIEKNSTDFTKYNSSLTFGNSEEIPETHNEENDAENTETENNIASTIRSNKSNKINYTLTNNNEKSSSTRLKSLENLKTLSTPKYINRNIFLQPLKPNNKISAFKFRNNLKILSSCDNYLKNSPVKTASNISKVKIDILENLPRINKIQGGIVDAYRFGTTNRLAQFNHDLKNYARLSMVITERDKYFMQKYVENANLHQFLEEIERKTKENYNKLALDFLPKLEEYLKFLRTKINEQTSESRMLIDIKTNLKNDIYNLNIKRRVVEKKLDEYLERKNFLICIKEKVKNLPEEFVNKQREICWKRLLKTAENRLNTLHSLGTTQYSHNSHSTHNNLHNWKHKLDEIDEEIDASIPYYKYLFADLSDIFQDVSDFKANVKDSEMTFMKIVKICNENNLDVVNLKNELYKTHKEITNDSNYMHHEIIKSEKILSELKEDNLKLREKKWFLLNNLDDKKEEENAKKDEKKDEKSSEQTSSLGINANFQQIKMILYKQKYVYKKKNSYLCTFLANIIMQLYKERRNLFLPSFSEHEYKSRINFVTDPDNSNSNDSREACCYFLFQLTFAVKKLYEQHHEYMKNPFCKDFILKNKNEIENKRRVKETKQLRLMLEEKTRLEMEQYFQRRQLMQYNLKSRKMDYKKVLYEQYEIDKKVLGKEGFDVNVKKVSLKNKKVNIVKKSDVDDDYELYEMINS